MLKKWTKSLLFLGAMVFPITVLSQDASVTDVSRIIVVQANHPQFTIRLKSNPTTGFSWALRQYDTQLLRWRGHSFEAPNNHLIGAGGMELFYFQLSQAALTQAHHGDIHFTYQRPWEKTKQGPEVVVHWCYTPSKARVNKETGC